MVAAAIWALSSVYYRVFQQKLGFLQLNLLRTSFASAALFLPAIYFGGFQSFGFAILSRIVSLAVVDSLFLIAIRKIGAPIAAPVAYTYVLFVQLSAQAANEVVPFSNFLSAAMVLLGVLLLSRSKQAVHRIGGVAFALGASAGYTAGNLLLKLSTNAGGNFLTIGFVRVGSAALALGVVMVLTRSSPRSFPKGFGKTDLASVV